MDAFDGAIARIQKTVSSKGAFTDSFLDRIIEFVIVLGIQIGGLASSVIFFVVTNFGVWALTSMYENNLGGLINSYLFAIPFFHNTLLSTLIYLLTIKVFFVTQNNFYSYT